MDNFDNYVILNKHNLPKEIDFEAGAIILINKPIDWTSFDVVNRIKYAIKHNLHLKKIKVGHAGTLDPLADGLLIVCTGKYTKLLENLSGKEKAYNATIKIGATTPCFDREAEEENHKEYSHLSDEFIVEAVQSFEKSYDQVPPIFSAVKVKGKNAYTLARRGDDIDLKSRAVTIYKIANISLSLPLINFDISVSKGTYIRSLANDLGILLQTGAYLHDLKRTSISKFEVKDALEVEEIVAYIKAFNKELNT